MFTSSVAGYKDFFPEGTKKHEDFVTGIPSDIVIRSFIAICFFFLERRLI